MINKLKILIKEAMIEKKETGNSIKYSVYKNILDKAQKDAKEKHLENNISDDIVIAATRKEIKQLEDTLSFVKEEVDKERYDNLINSIAIAKDFLPKSVDKDEILEYLSSNNIEKNIGICMKALKEQFGAKLDGKIASGVVKDYIKS